MRRGMKLGLRSISERLRQICNNWEEIFEYNNFYKAGGC